MPDWLIRHVTQQKEISGAFFIHYNLALRLILQKKLSLFKIVLQIMSIKTILISKFPFLIHFYLFLSKFGDWLKTIKVFFFF